MLGDLIARARKEKHVLKSELARRTNINIGHILHIEKNERNPSHRALKSICRALEIPYQPLMFTYDKVFTDEQIKYNMQDHIAYDKVLAVGSLDSFIPCPMDFPNAALALKITDDDMTPRLEKGTYAFVEFNSPLENKDIGIFEFNGKVMIRRYVIKKEGLILRADNKNIEDIMITETDKYNIIGKIVGTTSGLIF